MYRSAVFNTPAVDASRNSAIAAIAVIPTRFFVFRFESLRHLAMGQAMGRQQHARYSSSAKLALPAS